MAVRHRGPQAPPLHRGWCFGASREGGGLYLTGHLRCRATPHASFGSRGLSHGCPRK
jgi:hypothetical protein